MKILEFKSLIGEVKDVDMAGRRVTGYLSAFNNKDFDNDIIVKGAFSKSINERKKDIFFLNQHNWSQPHGKFQVLEEDEKGLYFESEPFVKGVSYSEDTLKLYEAGIIKEHSIGFITIKAENDSKLDARLIKEVKLFEGSNVTMGANNNTPFTGLKNLTLSEINDKCTLLYKAIRNGSFTDDTFVVLEYALKDLQLQAYQLGKQTLIKNEEPSLKDTPLIIEPSIDIIKEFTNSIKQDKQWKQTN